MKIPKLTPNEVSISVRFDSLLLSESSMYDVLNSVSAKKIEEKIQLKLSELNGLEYDVSVYLYPMYGDIDISVDIIVNGKENIASAMDVLDNIINEIYCQVKNIRIPKTKGTRIPLKVTNVSVFVDME